MKDLGGKVGISITKPYEALRSDIGKAKSQNRVIHFLPEYRSDNKVKLYNLMGISPSEVKIKASTEFIKAVIAQRSYKSVEEINEIDEAHAVTYEMHTTAMRMAKQGVSEQDSCSTRWSRKTRNI